MSEELIRLSISEISKKYWQTVEYRQLNTLEYLRTEEVKKKISIALSQFYTNGGSPWNKGIKYSDE